MLEAPLYAANGKKSGNVALPAEFFDGTVNEPVMHQAVKVFLSNQRQGTHSTKTRRWVTGGNQKPWRQKGTGRARQGSTRAPHWPGGGVVFGPHPRDYTQDIPKKQKQLARRSAFNARAREGALAVVDGLDFDAPKTAKLSGLLESMGLADQKVLVLTNGVKRNVYLSGRNLPQVQVLPYADAATYHVLWSSAVVVERGALTGEVVTTAAVAEAAPAAPKKRAAKKPAAPKTSAKPAAKKAAAPKADKKPAAKKAAPKKKGTE
ncbi:MAG: 50S ribosomal protein L4 [Gemmatimonadetes bacterium]|nr:50S ribosomal protein L4 [Gemmatimonadota bacterium]MCC7132976.1 50S ribosomal protein L4 [Gemmatimonadales bacterium]